MSFWIQTKGKDGRNRLVGFHFPFSLVIILLCFLAAILITFLWEQSLRYGVYSLVLIVTGVLSLAISRVNQFCKGKWLTWGMQDMPKPLRVFYYLGYGLIFVGLVLACNYFLRNS
jgi:hypothetical protein